jgi:O-acetyl-ADP-ribose deacetylase (regulator of RNase III)
MKPTPLTTSQDRRRHPFDHAARKSRRSPITDYNYHSVAFGGFSGRYTRYPPQSFWKIAGDYLKDEARHDFQSEGMLFAVISITAALPLINNVHALIEFVRAITSH